MPSEWDQFALASGQQPPRTPKKPPEPESEWDEFQLVGTAVAPSLNPYNTKQIGLDFDQIYDIGLNTDTPLPQLRDDYSLIVNYGTQQGLGDLSYEDQIKLFTDQHNKRSKQKRWGNLTDTEKKLGINLALDQDLLTTQAIHWDAPDLVRYAGFEILQDRGDKLKGRAKDAYAKYTGNLIDENGNLVPMGYWHKRLNALRAGGIMVGGFMLGMMETADQIASNGAYWLSRLELEIKHQGLHGQEYEYDLADIENWYAQIRKEGGPMERARQVLQGWTIEHPEWFAFPMGKGKTISDQMIEGPLGEQMTIREAGYAIPLIGLLPEEFFNSFMAVDYALQSSGYMGAIMVGDLIGLGTATAVGLGVGSVYSTARDAGASPFAASIYGTVVGPVYGAIEMIQWGQIKGLAGVLRQNARSRYVSGVGRGILKRLGRGGLALVEAEWQLIVTEGLEEGLQGVIEEGVITLVTGEKLTVAEFAQRFTSRFGEDFVQGGILAAILGNAGLAVQMAKVSKHAKKFNKMTTFRNALVRLDELILNGADPEAAAAFVFTDTPELREAFEKEKLTPKQLKERFGETGEAAETYEELYEQVNEDPVPFTRTAELDTSTLDPAHQEYVEKTKNNPGLADITRKRETTRRQIVSEQIAQNEKGKEYDPDATYEGEGSTKYNFEEDGYDQTFFRAGRGDKSLAVHEDSHVIWRITKALFPEIATQLEAWGRELGLTSDIEIEEKAAEAMEFEFYGKTTNLPRALASHATQLLNKLELTAEQKAQVRKWERQQARDLRLQEIEEERIAEERAAELEAKKTHKLIPKQPPAKQPWEMTLQNITRENVKRGYKQFLKPLKKAEQIASQFADKDIKVFGSTGALKRKPLAEREARHFLKITAKHPDLDILVNDPEIATIITSELQQINKQRAGKQYIDLHNKVKTGEWSYDEYSAALDKIYAYEGLADDTIFAAAGDFFKPTTVGLQWFPATSDFGESLKHALPIQDVVNQFRKIAVPPEVLAEYPELKPPSAAKGKPPTIVFKLTPAQTKGLPSGQLQAAKAYGLETAQEFVDKTYEANWKVGAAGWLVNNGRAIPVRRPDIGIQPGHVDFVPDASHESMNQFMQSGGIRFGIAETGAWLHMVVPPLSTQITAIKTILKQAMEYNQGDIYVRIAFGQANALAGQFEMGRGNLGEVMAAVGLLGENAAELAGTAFKLKPIPKERKFVTSVKREFPHLRVYGEYIPRSTDQLAIKAKNLIRDDLTAAEEIARKADTDVAVATAAELIKHYNERAAGTTDQATKEVFYDKAAAMANEVAAELTERGRTVQAAVILSRLTPEGQIRFAAREIQRYNEQVEKKRGGLFGLKKKIPELTGEQARHIKEEMDALTKMPEGSDKARRFQKLQQYIGDLVPTPLYNKLVTIWKAGLLTGIKTSGLNIFANVSHLATEAVKDIPATVFDKMLAIFTGERTTTITSKGIPEGAVEGTKRAGIYLFTGYDERNIGAKLDYKRVKFGDSKLARALQMYTQAVFRTLGAEDQPFYYAAKLRSLWSQARVAAINQKLKGRAAHEYANNLFVNPTEDMIMYASKDAEVAVFQNRTRLGDLAKGIQRLPGGEIVVPFGRTPAAVAMQIIHYSPVGAVATLTQNIGPGRFDQRDLVQALGRATIGTASMFLGAVLYAAGRIALDWPDDAREREQWKLEGKKPNAVLIGDKWRSVHTFGPAGNLLVAGAYVYDGFTKEGSPAAAAAYALFGTAKMFTEQTFLRGTSNILAAVTEPERSGPRVVRQLFASVIPTIIGDAAMAMDPKMRRTETTIERIMARIPILRERLEPRIDVLGQEREPVANPIELMIDPTRPSKKIDNIIVNELRRLWDNGFRPTPLLPGGRKGFEVLTAKENTDLWKRTGELIRDDLMATFPTKEYKDLPDHYKEQYIIRVASAAHQEVRLEMVDKKLSHLSGPELAEELVKYWQDRLLHMGDVERLYENGLITDADLDKLVKKGIITQPDADRIRLGSLFE